MIKVIGIYRNISDIDAFLKIFTQQILPILHKMPGVLGTDITPVDPFHNEVPEDLEKTEVIIETHFHSETDISNLLESPQGIKVLELIHQLEKICDPNIYYGHSKRFGTYGF